MTSSRVQSVLAHVDADETLELARALVRIPSITGDEGREISDFMLEWLRDAGLDAELQEMENGRFNVLARLEDGPGPRLMLNGHLDTKPVDNMTVEPFSAEVRDGRLYGRGACDMKSAVAAAMIAMRALKRSGVPLAGTVIFGSEVGEEGGGWRLVDMLDGPGACDELICCEPTELELHLGSRGGFSIAVTVKGIATHTGMAYTGVNAIEKMSKVITAMYALPCFHRVDPIYGRSPINAMEIHGGGKVTSSVPDECTTFFDIRLNPDLSPDELHRTLDELFERLHREDPQLDVTWQFRAIATATGMSFAQGRAAPVLEDGHPLAAAVRAAGEAATGAAPVLGGFPGGCSAGVMIRRGQAALIIGPGSLAQAHGDNEWIEIAQIAPAARIYAAAAAIRLDPDAQ